MMIIGAPDDSLAAPSKHFCHFLVIHCMCMYKVTGRETTCNPKTPHIDRDQPTPGLTNDVVKKKVREPDLDVDVEHEIRVEVHERGRDEETQGETQTTRTWVSPAPERKNRKKQRTASASIPNKERKRGTQTTNQTPVGS